MGIGLILIIHKNWQDRLYPSGCGEVHEGVVAFNKKDETKNSGGLYRYSSSSDFEKIVIDPGVSASNYKIVTS